MTITLVQEWATPPAASTTWTGPATTAGNTLIVRGTHRAGTNGLTMSLTDDAGNTWQLAGAPVAGNSGDGFLFYCLDAAPITSITISPVASLLFLTEWSGVGTVADITSQANASTTTPPPALALADTPGSLVYGALSATVSNRVFVIEPNGFTEGVQFRATQMTSLAAYLLDAGPGEWGPQWRITSGGASTSGAVTVVFRPAGTDPDPDPPVQGAVRGDGTSMQAHLLTPAGLVPVRAHQEAV